MMQVINISKLIEKRIFELKDKYLEIKNIKNKDANFTMIVVGDDKATKSYIKSKEKLCSIVGIKTNTINLPENVKSDEIIKIIEKLNRDEDITAILLQMPLPKHLNSLELMDKISPYKDVDGLTSINMGKLVLGNSQFIPCTAKAIIKVLDYINVDVEGKDVLIIGRSNIVGKPLANLLINKGATVQICNSKTKDLINKTKKSKIIISATGVKNLINSSYISEDSILLDVGITRINNKLYGDFDFHGIIDSVKSGYITKVPGGIGPVTVLSLIENIIIAYEKE